MEGREGGGGRKEGYMEGVGEKRGRKREGGGDGER